MGAIDFDPSPWLDRAEMAPAKVAKLAKVEPMAVPALAAFAGLAAEPSLPPAILHGLATLERLSSPRGVSRALSAEVVSDALRLRNDGWATTALALGWSALDLFGHSEDHDGLAAWLRGRPIRFIDRDGAIVVDTDPDRRAGFNRCRRGMPGAMLLWEIGR